MKRLNDKREGLLNFSDYKKTANRVLYGLIIFFLAIFALTALLPIFYLLVTSFKTVSEINSNIFHFFPEHFELKKMVELWNKISFGKYYLNTLIVVTGSIVCSVIFNSLLAYAIAILKPIGYKIINGLILLGYMIPTILAIFPLLANIKDLGLINSYLPLFLMYGANSYYYLLLKNNFEKIPKSFIEAAKMDGLNDLEIFFKIVLPLSKSIIGVVAIFTLTASYSDFLLPYLVLQDNEMQTVMVAIYRLSNTTTLDQSEKLMLLLISIIPQIIVFAIFQKQIMGNDNSSGIKE